MVEVGKRAPRPIVANMIEKGKTPVLSRAELSKMGFDLILYPLAGIFAAAQALKDVYEKLKRDETTQGMYDRLMTFEAFNDLIGVEEKYKVAERFGVKD
jgi:2-methylisocitrate lyase-like PEP mutase family enzyme